MKHRITDLEANECRWPIDCSFCDGTLGFCAVGCAEGESYCAPHRARAGGGRIAPAPLPVDGDPAVNKTFLKGAGRTAAQRAADRAVRDFQRENEANGLRTHDREPDLVEIFRASGA